jgi:signal transduction histidine kinase
MFFQRIRIRLILFFVALMAVLLAVGGLSIQWTIRRSMEDELGKKLEAVASAASVFFDEEDIGFMLAQPGPRLKQYLTKKLILLRKQTGVKRIFLFDLADKNLLDTRNATGSGGEVFSLRFYRKEMDLLKRGKSSHTILFQGIDGGPTMTGFSPLVRRGETVGGVGADGSATFLDSLDRLRRRLVQIALIGVFATMVLAQLLAGTITRPIAKLVKSSEQIGRGNYGEPIPPLGKSEIGVLAETMEAMRRNVVERERELKAMVAGVAHEIRNPLGGIELFTGLLADEVAKRPDAKKHVEKIEKEIRYLKGIVDSFLEYARPNEPRREPCRVREILREATALAEREMKTSGISTIFSDGMDALVALVDPCHFKRMALNLVQNAVQAMPEGGRLTIEGRAEGRGIHLRFTDTGIGVPPDVQARIFSPFFTTREKGTGLGLSIVKQLAEANGGRVSLVRSDGKGTVFEMELVKG